MFLDVAMVWKGKPASSVTTGSRERSDLCAEIIIIIISENSIDQSIIEGFRGWADKFLRNFCKLGNGIRSCTLVARMA